MPTLAGNGTDDVHDHIVEISRSPSDLEAQPNEEPAGENHNHSRRDPVNPHLSVKENSTAFN